MSKPRRSPAPGGIALRWLALGLFLSATAAAFLTAPGYGIASDVGNYFQSSLLQLTWGRDLWTALMEGRPAGILNHETVFEHWRWYIDRIPHPPLSRELSGLGWLLTRDATDPLSAYRTAVMLTFGALTASVGVYTAWRVRSLAAGLAAGLAVPAIPALFAHGHLAHTDLFLSAFWFWSVASLDVALQRGGARWLLGAGLFFGAATATKFTGLLLLPVLAVWLLSHRGGAASLLVLALTGALVFVAVNPVMWVDPAQGLRDYVQAGLGRAGTENTRILTEYFGTIYPFRPPWHYPFVWTAIVLPIPLLLAIGVGLVVDRSTELRALVPLNMAVLYGALSLPTAPLHDGIRLFLPLFPLYCVLVGTGTVGTGEIFARALRRVAPWTEGRRDLIVALVLVAVLALPLFRTAEYHPHQLSYFNALVGGVEGAERRGLEVTNLKEVLNRDALADLAELVPDAATVDPGFFMEEVCFDQAVHRAPAGWKAETQLTKPDGTADVALACEGAPSFVTVALARPAAVPDFAFVLNRRAQWRRLERALTNFGGPPLYEVAVDGVPLLQVYRTR